MQRKNSKKQNRTTQSRAVHSRHNAQASAQTPRKDGLAATNESVYQNLAENAWFPALYADEILMDEQM